MAKNIIGVKIVSYASTVRKTNKVISKSFISWSANYNILVSEIPDEMSTLAVRSITT